MSNRVHSFFVRIGPRPQNAAVEQGIEVWFVTAAEIAQLTAKGEFVLQLHLGALLLAGLPATSI
jgi:hypothetical protein